MPPLDLHQRIAVVTGAATGIGRAIAARLLTAGAAVCLWDRAAEALTTTTRDLTSLGPVEAVTVDVTDPAAVSGAVQATRTRFGGIDILVNNAGIAGPNAPLWEYPLEAWRQVVEVNLLGTFYCCRAVVPVMLQGGYGRIINIASIAGKEGNPQASAYSASKAGVIRPHQIPGQGVGPTRHCSELCHPRRRGDRPVPANDLRAYSVYVVAYSHGALWAAHRNCRAGGLAGLGGVLV